MHHTFASHQRQTQRSVELVLQYLLRLSLSHHSVTMHHHMNTQQQTQTKSRRQAGQRMPPPACLDARTHTHPNWLSCGFTSPTHTHTHHHVWQEGHPACKKTERWGAGVVICLEWGADMHMSQLMPLPLTVSCFSKIQIGFTFLVVAHLGSPGKRAVKRVCVCV